MKNALLALLLLFLLAGAALGGYFLSKHDAGTEAGSGGSTAPADNSPAVHPTSSSNPPTGTVPPGATPGGRPPGADAPSAPPSSAPPTRRPPPQPDPEPMRELSEAEKALVGTSWGGEHGSFELRDDGSVAFGSTDSGSWKLDGDEVIVTTPIGEQRGKVVDGKVVFPGESDDPADGDDR